MAVYRGTQEPGCARSDDGRRNRWARMSVPAIADGLLWLMEEPRALRQIRQPCAAVYRYEVLRAKETGATPTPEH